MKQQSLVPIAPRRRRYGSYMGEISPAPDNLLNRDFSANAPNEKWVTDITEFQIPAGKVYLSPMIDCFDGMAVSWSIGPWCIRIVAVTTAGLAGYPGSQRPNSFARCHARRARQTMRPAKASLAA